MSDLIELHAPAARNGTTRGWRIVAPIAAIGTLCGLVWAFALTYSRIDAGERADAQHEKWIAEQTARLTALEAAVTEIRISAGRVETKVNESMAVIQESLRELRADLRRGGP